jgi:hypothetical protein
LNKSDSGKRKRLSVSKAARRFYWLKKGRVLLLFLRQTGEQFQTLLRAGLHTASAENAPELLKVPLLGLPGHFESVGRTFFGTHAAEDTFVFFNDQFAPLPGEWGTLDCRIVPGHRTLDQIAQNIFEYGK